MIPPRTIIKQTSPRFARSFAIILFTVMKKNLKIIENKSIKYTAAILIGLLIAAVILIFRADPLDPKNLSDAFFVPAMLYICFGLLSFASNEGTLDIISYAFSFLFSRSGKHQRYYEYKEYKKGRRKPTPYYIIFIGLFFLIPSFVLYLLPMFIL
ncbi:MAG: DUF3899 domain-containing protein [Ruminococcaceae bacterium]|nr:DUF3899 domain-containing protein [Oscillospiraceae bacterium]